MHLRIKLCGFFVAASLASTLSAAGILSDVFESYSSGTKLGTNSDWSTVSAPNGTFVIEEGAQGNPLGAQNQYLDVSDYSSSKSNRLQSANFVAASNALTTFSLDFVEPSLGGSDSISIGYAMTSADLNSDGHRLRIYLDDGEITGLTSTAANTYSLDTAYRLYIVFNDTSTPEVHADATIAAHSAGVWLEALGVSSPVYAGSVTAGNQQTASYRVSIRSFNSSVQSLWIDDVTLETGLNLMDLNPPNSGAIYATLSCSHPAVAEGGHTTLEWNGFNLPSGATFEISSDADVTFLGDESGSAAAYSGQVDLQFVSISGDTVTFTLSIYDESDALVAYAREVVKAYDYSGPVQLPHPSVNSSKGQLELMKELVNNQADSIAKAGWDAMLLSPFASLSYVHTPQEIVTVVPSGVNASETAFRNDCQAARCHALQWVVTGNIAHRDKAMEILNDISKAFRGMVSTGSGGQVQLECAWMLPTWLSAADIIRYHDKGSAGWDPADIASFQHFAEILYGHARQAVSRGNNWGVSAAFAMMSYGAWSDDIEKFEEGLTAQYNLLNSLSEVDGEIAETCRDTWHPQYSIVSWIDSAEIARNLGRLDLYEATFDGQTTPRLAIILEYFSNLMLGNTTHPCGGNWSYDYLGEYSIFDNYEVAYNHYIAREQVSYLPEFKLMVEDFWRNDVGTEPRFLLWSRLTHGDNHYAFLPPPETYDSWAFDQFDPHGITDPAEIGAAADANKDGISNELHFWTLTDPLGASSEAIIAPMPVEAPNTFKIRFVEREDAATYGRTLRSSESLGQPSSTWPAIQPTSIQTIEDRGDQVLREATFPAMSASRFFTIEYPEL